MVLTTLKKKKAEYEVSERERSTKENFFSWHYPDVKFDRFSFSTSSLSYCVYY
jgi:hypothetical protein